MLQRVSNLQQFSQGLKMEQYLPPFNVSGRLITKNASKSTIMPLKKIQSNIPLGTNMLNQQYYQIAYSFLKKTGHKNQLCQLKSLEIQLKHFGMAYFINKVHSHSNIFILVMQKSTEQAASHANQTAIKTVAQEISSSRIEIPGQQKSLNISKVSKSRNKLRNQKKQEQKLHNILRKKEELEIQLSRIRLQQMSVKQKRVAPLSESEQSKTKFFRSTITAEEKMRISKILKETNKFEKEAAQKSKRLLQKIEKLEEEEKRGRQQRERQMSETKKKEVAEKLQKIKNRKQTRTKTISQRNKDFQKVLNQRSMHDKIQQSWKIIEATQQEENQKILAQKLQDKKFDAEQIKAHSRRYSEIANHYKIQREESTKRVREDLIKQSRMTRYPSSTFFKHISSEEEMKRRKSMERTEQPHMFRAKKTMYGETVREKNNKSPKKVYSPPQSTIDIRSAKSLDNLGKIKLGNDYMKKIHSNIKDAPLQSFQISQINKAKAETQVFKYPDYLTETRKTRQRENPEHESQDIVQLKKIIKQKDEDQSTRLFKAKLLAQRLDSKADSSSKNMVDSIAAKLSIIEEFSQSAK